jgi:NitT/TauT family transport system substrate-binding protein
MVKKYIIVFLTFLLFTGCSSVKNDEQMASAQQAIIGVYNGESSLLFIIAEQEGYFKKYGTDVKLVPYPTGRDAMLAMLHGETDFSLNTDFVVVKNNKGRTNFRIIASVAQIDINNNSANISSGIFAKKSSGINKPSDLRGKNLATTMNTITEFLCGVFLEQHGMAFTDANVINIDREDRENFIDSPKYDAFFVWELHLQKLYKTQTDKLNYFPMASALPFHFVLLVDEQYQHEHPDVPAQVLHALCDAEEWVKNHKDEVTNIIIDRFKLSEEFAAASLKRHHFVVNFPYTLPKALESQSNWLKRYKNIDKIEADYFTTLLDTTPLKSVKPASITIIE